MHDRNAYNALEFARAHDWGRDAYLDDQGRITNLHDVSVNMDTGEVTVATATVPATVPAVRAFGQY